MLGGLVIAPGRCFIAVLVLALEGTISASGSSQELRSMGVDRSCACTIVLRRVARLGRADDTVSISARTSIARDSRGRFYAAPVSPSGVVAVMDSSGRMIGTVGRSGSGPGDLGAIRYVRVSQGDSLLVMDRARLSVFGPGGNFARTSALPPGFVGFRFGVMLDSKIVLNNYFPTRKSFTLLNAHHDEVLTFGRSVAGQPFPDSDALQFLVVGIDSGRFISVQQNHNYLVQIWDTSGVLIKEFRRSPSWFSPWSHTDRLERGPRSPPFPAVVGAFVDLGRRKLWIAAVVPDRAWQGSGSNATERGGRAERPASIDLSEYPRAYDTIVEVVDLDSGKLEVSQRFDDFVPYFMEGGLMYGLREESSGLYVVETWRAQVETRR